MSGESVAPDGMAPVTYKEGRDGWREVDEFEDTYLRSTVLRVLDEEIAVRERAFVPSSVLMEAMHSGEIVALHDIRARFTREAKP